MMMRHIAKGIVVALCVAAGAAPAAAQTADEIVEKSLAASGGRAALAKIASRSTVGSMQVSTAGGDFPATIEILNQAPNKGRTVITLDLTAAGAGSVVIEQRFDGEHGYSIDPLRGNGDMPEAQVATQRNNIFPSPFLGYKDRGTKIALAGKEKVGDRDAYVLTITPASGPGSRVFIDAENYLTLKGITTLELPEVGSVEQAVEFSDYRDVDGIKVPFTIKGSSSVQTFTITVSKVEHNVKIDPALFVKPAAR
jgi:outer membrane lipoprotein-sorting protein